MKLILIILTLLFFGCAGSKVKSIKQVADTIIICNEDGSCDSRRIEKGDK